MAGLIILAGAVAGWAQTNLTVVRHNDNTLWKMTCDGTSNCSAWTQITGGFSVQPTLTWDPAINKYILIGIGNNGSSIWRSTFNADATWNNDWALVGTGATGSPSPVAVTGGAYGRPSWDQQLPASTRFIVLSNWGSAAVLDRETGLVWEKSPSTSTFSWLNGQSHCNELTVGNRKGWRLPTIQELASLVDPTQYNPALPSGHPFLSVQSDYWSSTTSASNTSDAWGVGFFLGGVAFWLDKSDSHFVWCVRGGQGVDPQ